MTQNSQNKHGNQVNQSDDAMRNSTNQSGGQVRKHQADDIGDQNNDGKLDMYQDMGRKGGSQSGQGHKNDDQPQRDSS